VITKFMALHLQSTDKSVDARPLAFSIEKVDSTTDQWSALEHFSRDCNKYFPSIPKFQPFDIDPDFTRVLCTEYPPVDDDSPYDDYYNE
ncbi:unnamed protein product, partial [Candidula unifasciata]